MRTREGDDEEEQRDTRKIVMYDDEALKLMQGWTGGETDPLYAISSTGGWNYAWVFTDAIANIDRDLSRVKKLGRNKFQLGQGTFSKAEIDELHTIRDALAATLEDPDSVMVDEGRNGRTVRASRGAEGRWTVSGGREINFDGHRFVGVSREGNTEPAVADGMTHLIVELLNQAGTTPDEIYRRHMGHARRARR